MSSTQKHQLSYPVTTTKFLKFTVNDSIFFSRIIYLLDISFMFLQSTKIRLGVCFPATMTGSRGDYMAACWRTPKCRLLTEQLEQVTAKCATCANSFINGDTPTEALTDDWEPGEQRNWHTVISKRDNNTAWMTFHSSLCGVAKKDGGV